MGMSAAHCQGNVREYQSVWRMVTLQTVLGTISLCCCIDGRVVMLDTVYKCLFIMTGLHCSDSGSSFPKLSPRWSIYSMWMKFAMLFYVPVHIYYAFVLVFCRIFRSRRTRTWLVRSV